jgi:hypothetical protein
MAKFGFQDLKIWQLAMEIADELFDIADQLEERKLFQAGFKFSEVSSEG